MNSHNHIPSILGRLTLLLLIALTFESKIVQAQTGTEYYLKNVATGKWLGPGNNWGTQASLMKHPYWFKLQDKDNSYGYANSYTLPNGTYRLETQVEQSGGHFLGEPSPESYFLDRPANDGAWDVIITRTDDGRYTLQKEGGSYFGYNEGSAAGFGVVTTGSYAWRVRSHEQMVESLKDATEGNPVDATFLILDPDFSKNNRDAAAWVRTGSVTFSAGDEVNRVCESWHSDFSIAQTVTGVPNGIYELIAQGFYQQNGTDSENLPVFFLNGQTQAFSAYNETISSSYTGTPITGSSAALASASRAFVAGQYNLSTPIRVTVTDNTLTLGARLEGNDMLWCVWDNFSLVYKGLDSGNGQTSYGDYSLGVKVKALTEGEMWRLSDATFLLKNPNFNEAAGAGWTMVSSNDNYVNLSGGNADNLCAEAWHATFTLSQTIYNVPNGWYSLVAQGFYRQDGEDNEHLPQFFINGEAINFFAQKGTEGNMAQASTSFTNNDPDYNIACTVKVTDNTITFGARLEENNSLWCVFDNFRLYYRGDALEDYGDYMTDEMREQVLSDMKTATADSPKDATFLIKNAGFSHANQEGEWTVTHSGGGNYFFSSGLSSNPCTEVFHESFNIYQTINNVPNGIYELTAQGFYRSDEGDDGVNRPQFYLNSLTQEFPVMNSAQTQTMDGASESFANGYYTIEPVLFVVVDNTITVGAKLESNTGLWCIFDNFKLTYKGLMSWQDDHGVYATGSTNKFYVEYTGASTDTEKKWLSDGSFYESRAVMKDHPHYVLLNKSGNNYTIQSQQTGNNNLGPNSSGDITDPYMNVATAINFQLDPVSGQADTYHITSEGTDYGRSATTDANGFYTLMGYNVSKWEIVSREEMLKNMIQQGSEASPFDATWLIKDHDFGRNNRDQGYWTITGSKSNLSGGNNVNNCAESFHSIFTLTQTFNSVPNGIYELKAQGFYRQDGTDNTHLPYFYINGETATFPVRTGTENNMSDASVSFSAGNYTINPIRIYVSDGTITLGAKLEDNTQLWCIWDNFELNYLGNPSEEKLNENKYYIRNVATGKWLGPANDNGYQVSLCDHAQYVILHPQTNNTYFLESQIRNKSSNYYFGEMGGRLFLAATTPLPLDILPTSNGHYTISINGQYLGNDGSTVVSRNASGINAEWEILTHDQMLEEMTSGKGTGTYPTDATFLIKDPNFDRMHRFEGSWAKTSGTIGGNSQNQCIEVFKNNFKLTQVLQNVPNGIYRLTAQGFYRVETDGNDINKPHFFLNGTTIDFPVRTGSENNMSNASTSFSAGQYKVTTANVTVTNGRIELGAELVDNATLWSIWDNFELEYLGPVAGTSYYHADVSTSGLWVIPKQSFLADRADALHDADGIDFPTGFLQHNDGWKTSEYGQQLPAYSGVSTQPAGHEAQIQNGSVYTTTHYVKQGEWSPVFLTTNNGQTQSHHDLYQRWYYFDKNTSPALEKPLGGDMMAPQNWAYQYANGLVMGTQLKNGDDKSIDLNGGTQPITMAMQLKLPTGKTELIVGGDITRYSDLRYANTSATTAAAAGNLTETTLSLRHIYILRDAKEMAQQLTAMTGDNYLEESTIHFPSRTIGVRDDHVPLNLELRDYWFFRSGNAASTSNDDLQNITGDNFLKIEVNYPDGPDLGFSNFRMIVAPSTNRGITDINDLYPIDNTPMLRRRLVNFSYPAGGEVAGGSRMQILVKAHNPERNEDYNLARFTIIFDSNSETLPYMDIVGEDAALSNRSSQSLRALVEGEPVAHIDFDFPIGQLFQAPNGLAWFHGIKNISTNTVGQSGSALPFQFENSNYSFSTMSPDDMWMPQWGDYTIGFETQNSEPGCGTLHAYPVSKYTNDQLDKSLQSGFLFVDASDLPGTVATIPFTGNFCQGSRMVCTGWMASRIDQMPGSVILEVIGITESDSEEPVYVFCPGQVGLNYRRYGETTTTRPESNTDYVWQQFYFDFLIDKKYNNYVLRVENNCESTNGGDYMLDDIWVWVQRPTLEADRTSPLCGGSLDLVEMEVNYSTLLSATGVDENDTETTRYLTFVYLDWEKFLSDFKTGLVNKTLESTPAYDTSFTINGVVVSVSNLTFEQMGELIRSGAFALAKYDALYKKAFFDNLVQFSNNTVAYANFPWSNKFTNHTEYVSLSSLTTDPSKVYRTGEGDSRKLLLNGSFRKYVDAGTANETCYYIEDFEYYHYYALLAYIGSITEIDVASLRTGTDAQQKELLDYFDVRENCSSRSILYFTPKTQILGTLGAMSFDEVPYCENTSLTFGMELTGISNSTQTLDGASYEEGDDVVLKDVYFDWWMGKPGTPATVENYKEENNGDTGSNRIDLYTAMKAFRYVNPNATSLYSPDIKLGTNPDYSSYEFTNAMLTYLRSLANPSDGSAPQLILHSKLVDVHVTSDFLVTEKDKNGEDQKYVKFVAIPIETNISNIAKDYIYYCEEPLPFRVLIIGRAPGVREGFTEKHYPSKLATLSIRIAKSQFEKVRTVNSGPQPLLHIPLRGVHLETAQATGVENIGTPQGDVVMIANSTDAIMQDYITERYNNLLPPVIGTIDYFYAKRGDDSDNFAYNERLAKVHFSNDFQVREGYSYTLRMPFKEKLSVNTELLTVATNFTPTNGSTSSTTSVTLTYGNDGKWNGAQSYNLDDNMKHFVSGGNNPKSGSLDENNNSTGGNYSPSNPNSLPQSGTYYVLRPTAAGVIKAGIVLNNSKSLYVTDGSGNCLNNNIIVTDNNGVRVMLDNNYQVSEKLYGFIQFPVAANTDYYLFSNGSKLGFFGFYFYNGEDFPTTCEGTVDIILKIVPDYEVWTAEALNTDWSNDENWRRADYNELYAGNGSTLKNSYLPNGNPATAGSDERDNFNYVTAEDRTRRQGFAPLYCTNILLMTDDNPTTTDIVPAPILYDDGAEMETVDNGAGGTTQRPTGFPALRNTSSPLIRYDFQCHEWTTEFTSSLATDDPTTLSRKQAYCATGDMVTELYSTNVCDKIAFQPEAELLNTHLLNYKKAWVEYELSKNQWHLLSSPLQDMLSAEWYAPTYSARQETTYFEDIMFDVKPTINNITYRYDRFAPAVYQRSWDKAKAVIYERGASWNSADGNQDDSNVGSDETGQWVQVGTGDNRYYEWSTESMNADEYLHRLTYKPMGDSKANVAVKGTWSGVYNDHTVPYSSSGFSVMPINNLKGGEDASSADTPWGHNAENIKTMFRLPKEDYYYDIWDWGKSYGLNSRTRVYLNDGRTRPTATWNTNDSITAVNTLAVPNRGRLRSDVFQSSLSEELVDLDPETTNTETVTVHKVILKNEGQGSIGFFLASNPFICGLDMQRFFEVNSTVIEPYYLTLKTEDLADNTDQISNYSGTWTWSDMGFRGIKSGNPATFHGEDVMPARYAFFVKAKDATANAVTVRFSTDMMVSGRKGTSFPTVQATPATPVSPIPPTPSLRIRAERSGLSSEATVELNDKASNIFRPEEDLETFLVDGITNNIPVVYTLCGRLATSINRLHDFNVLPIGIESNSYKMVTLTFNGVEQLGDSVAFYDAVKKELTPLKSGMQFQVSGQTQNRYYLVHTLVQEEAAIETHLQIFTSGLTAKVIASTEEPIASVRCFDTSGRLVHSAKPQTQEYSFSLPKAGVYIIEAQTEKDHKTKKVILK